MMRIFILLLSFLCLPLRAQTVQDTLPADSSRKDVATYRFHYKQLIAPVALLSVGYAGVKWKGLKKMNEKIREGLMHHTNHHSADNYLQYLPQVGIYGLSLLGAEARHGYGDRTIVLATSYIAMAAIVNGLKWAVEAPRPSGGADNSFPSGHTATAFMGAEIIRQEYWKASPWYGVAAYAFAAGIGYARIYNDRHWATDVLAGAGAGILSARIGYWLLPYTRRIFQKKQKRALVLASPFYHGPQQGGGVTLTATLF